MYKTAGHYFKSCYAPIKRFWRALLRFGSPRFSVETFDEFLKLQADNDDECSDAMVDGCGQLEAA